MKHNQLLILMLAAIFFVCCRKQNGLTPPVIPNGKPFSTLLGGTDFETARSINTPDGGLILAGYTASKDGDVHGSHGKSEAWIVKLNSDGDTLWTRTLGGTEDDQASNVCLTADGGYMITGSTASSDGDVTDKRPGFGTDLWLI